MDEDKSNMKLIAESLERISLVLERLTDGNDCVSHMLSGVEAAKYLGCSPATITSMRKSGKIRATRVNNRWMYRRSDLVKLTIS